MPGSPDWQQITEWFGPVQTQATGAAIGATTLTLGPYDLSTYSSVIVAVKPTGGTITGTISQTIPGGPSALADVTTFTVADGAVAFEAVVLLAGRVTVTLTGSAGGETVTYAIVPANTNVNTNVTSGGTVTNITPIPLASWPPASPVNGDVQVLEIPSSYDPVGGKLIRWLCSYNATDAAWDVAGPPLYAEVTTLEGAATAAYGNLATVGPAIALPRPMDAQVEVGARLGYAAAVNGRGAYMSYAIGATAAADADAVYAFDASGGAANNSQGGHYMRAREKTGLTAVTLTAKYRVDSVADSADFANRWMRVLPRRIT